MTNDDLTFDLTDPKIFPIALIFAIVFGGMIGAGIFVTFSNLHVPPDKGLAIIMVLFIVSCVIGYVPHLYTDYKLKRGYFEPEDEEDEEE